MTELANLNSASNSLGRQITGSSRQAAARASHSRAGAGDALYPPPVPQQKNSRNVSNVLKSSPSVLGAPSIPRAKTLLMNRQSIDSSPLLALNAESTQMILESARKQVAHLEPLQSPTNSQSNRSKRGQNLTKVPRREFFRRGRSTADVDEYSEGESGSEFPVKYKSLKRNRQIQRVVFMWRKAYSRAVISARMVYSCHMLHQELLMSGSTATLFGQSYNSLSLKKKMCLIMPNHRFKSIWTITIIVLLIYTAIFVPYKIAFIEDESLAQLVIDAVVDILFGLDIVINFLSARETSSGKLITDHKKIAKAYLSGWFWLDLLACFPFQVFDFSGDESSSGESSSFSANKELVRLARLPRLYRLIRLMRLFKMLRLLKNSRLIADLIELVQVNASVTRLLKTLFGVLYLVHLFACIWFFTATWSRKYDSWVDMMGLWDEEPQWKYLISVYWALQTVTTVGFGDIGITHLEEYVLSILWILFGVAFYTLTIGNVSSIIANADEKAFYLSKKLETLQCYALKIGLPPETALRIQRFLENDSKDLNSLDEQELLIQQLPPSLRNEIVEFASRRILDELPFFKDKPVDFQHKVLPLLKARKLYAGDILYSEGDVAEELIFVQRGTFYLYKDISDKIQLPDKLIDLENQAYNVPFVQYRSESYFGDQDMLYVIEPEGAAANFQKYYRESTAQCIDDAEILIIKRRQIIDELNKFHTVRDLMQSTAKEKRTYHKILVNSILQRYKDPLEAQRLIFQRMEDQGITTHMSLKQALKKNKDRSKMLSQMPRQRNGGNLLNSIALDQADYNNAHGGDLDEEEVEPEQQIRLYQEAPVIDVMRHKVSAVLESITPDMRKTIDKTLLKPPSKAADHQHHHGGSNNGHQSNASPRSPRLASAQSRSSSKNAQAQEELDNKIADLLEESETYLEKNLNAGANNMSLLALHSVEVASHVERQRAEQETQERVIKNIEAHASFMSQKSAELNARLESAALKFGYRKQ